MLLSDFCVLKQVLRKLEEKIYIIFIDFIKKEFFHNKKRGRKKTYDLRITLAIKGAISLCFEYNAEQERSQMKV